MRDQHDVDQLTRRLLESRVDTLAEVLRLFETEGQMTRPRGRSEIHGLVKEMLDLTEFELHKMGEWP